MGSSAGASIIYGLPFSGFDFPLEGDELYDRDEEVWLAHFQGLSEPEDTDPDARREYFAARDLLPITIEYSGDATTGHIVSFLCIRESVFGNIPIIGIPIPVDHIKPPPPEWDVLLMAFCRKAGLSCVEYPPSWRLVASFG